MLQIVGAELAEAVAKGMSVKCQRKTENVFSQQHILSFVPCHNVRKADLVETGKKGERGEDEGRDDPFPLVEGLEEGWLLSSLSSEQWSRHTDQADMVAHLYGLLLLVVSLWLTLHDASLGGHITPSQAIAGIEPRARGLGNSGHSW